MKLDYINRRAMFVFRDKAAKAEVVSTLRRLIETVGERSHTTAEEENLILACMCVQLASAVED